MYHKINYMYSLFQNEDFIMKNNFKKPNKKFDNNK
jgi:hypothetical protein